MAADIMDQLIAAMGPSTGATSPVPKTAGKFYPRSKGAARIVLNRAKLDEITLAAADGMFALAQSVITRAAVPDATPFGEGLVEGGGVIAWVNGRQVGNWSKAGASVKKPRSARAGKGVSVVAGYGFPARFQEEGTANQPAHPFLTPALMAAVPDAGNFVREACIKRGIINATRRAVGDVYGASASKAARSTVSRTRTAVRKVGSGGGV